MKTKIFILFIILSVFISLLLTSCAKLKTDNEEISGVLKTILKNGVIRVGTDFVGTPFAYYENGKETGFEVELMQEIAKEMDVKIEWKKISFGMDNFRQLLDKNEVDIILESVSRTSERMKDFDFSLSYFSSGQAVILRKNEMVPDLFELNFLKNQNIGAEKDTTGAKFAKNNTSGKIIEYESSQKLIDALINEEVYAIISDIFSTQTSGWKYWKQLKVVLKGLTSEEYCFIIKKGETALLFKLNSLLSKLKEDPIDGVYAKLYRKWFY